MSTALASRHRCSTYLDLVDSWRPQLPNILDLLDMPDTVIADANVPRFAIRFRLLQGLPHQLPTLFPSVGAVYQEKIHISIFTGQLLDTVLDGLVCRFKIFARREDLGGDIELGTGNSRFANSLANARFVGVILSGVDVAIASFDGGEAGLYAGRRWGLVDAESDLWDLVL